MLRTVPMIPTPPIHRASERWKVLFYVDSSEGGIHAEQ